MRSGRHRSRKEKPTPASVGAKIAAHCMLDTAETAVHLGLSPRTLEDFRLSGLGPTFVRMSPKAIRYRPADLSKWIEARLASSTSDVVGQQASR